MQHTFTSLEERSLIKLYTVDGEERERDYGVMVHKNGGGDYVVIRKSEGRVRKGGYSCTPSVPLSHYEEYTWPGMGSIRGQGLGSSLAACEAMKVI